MEAKEKVVHEAAFHTVIDAFNTNAVDGTVGAFIDGIVCGLAYVSANHVIDGQEDVERALIHEQFDDAFTDALEFVRTREAKKATKQ